MNNVAPGVDVVVAHHNSLSDFTTVSGSQLAAGHAAGVAALLRSIGKYPSAYDVYETIDMMSQKNVFRDLPWPLANQIVNIAKLVDYKDE